MADIPSSKQYGRGGTSSPSPTTATPHPTASASSFTPGATSISFPKSKNGWGWLAGLVIVAIIGWFGFSGVGRTPSLAYTAYTTERVVQVLPSTHVNARTGPGVEYPILVDVSPGTNLKALGTTQSSDGGTWIAVKKNDGTACYINSRFLIQK